jgi:hypothetical protein
MGMKPYQIASGAYGFIMEQLGNFYSTVPEAFKEYVTNSVDAIRDATIKRNMMQRGTVNVVVNKGEKWVLVQDDGPGMEYNVLSDIPVRIGDSIKKGSGIYTGEKHLGFLAFHKFSDSATLFSRHVSGENSPKIGVLKLSKQGHDSFTNVYDRLAVPEMVKSFLDNRRMPHGTVTLISDMDERVMNQYFGPKSLENLLSETYTPLLSPNADFLDINVLSIGKGGNFTEIDVKPLEFQGEDGLDDIMEVRMGSGKKGKIRMYVKINPDGTNEKVRVYHTGVLVTRNIANIAELNMDPWNTGKLSGWIDDDFLELNAARNSFEIVNKESFREWTRLMKEMGGYLKDGIKESKTHENDQFYGIAEKVMRALETVYSSLDIGKIFSATKTPLVKTCQEGDVERIVRDSPKFPRPRVSNGSRPQIEPVRRDRKFFQPHIQDFAVEDAAYRSRLSGHIIYINSNHSDFHENYTGRPEYDQALYVLHLMANEIGFEQAKVLGEKNDISPDAIRDKSKETTSEIYFLASKELSKTTKKR